MCTTAAKVRPADTPAPAAAVDATSHRSQVRRAQLVCLRRAITVFSAICVLSGCPREPENPGDFTFDLPEGFPAPRVPDDNPMSDAKVELGRYLFYDTRLSENQEQSCASCHQQDRAFSDGLGRGVGSTGEMHPRGAMSLANVAYAATLNWANPVVRSLEEQALTPLFGEDPIELGLRSQTTLLARLEAQPIYQDLFEAAYPDDPAPITLFHVTQALAAFQRTLISGNSAYDRFVYGDADAISESARRGAEIFFGEDAECFHCHGGFNFSSSVDHDGNVFDQASFQNNGLYNLDGRGAYPADNPGLFEFTGDEADEGAFKPPTLRNIAVTAPYMHDGSLETLDEVVAMYAAGGRVTESGPNAGDGRTNPNKSIFVAGFELSDSERADLVAFLESLTDETFLTNPALSNPWE